MSLLRSPSPIDSACGNRYYGFRVDPFQTNRVWFQSRSKATHTGPLLGTLRAGLRSCGQRRILQFDEVCWDPTQAMERTMSSIQDGFLRLNLESSLDFTPLR